MIAKGCPKCDQQVPVACKACPCGHLFFNNKRCTKEMSPEFDFARRPQRLKREKPNYYDSLEHERDIRRNKQRLNNECPIDDQLTKKDKNTRRHIKKEELDDEELLNTLSPEKQSHCSIILDDLNRKLGLVMWKPTENVTDEKDELKIIQN